MYANRLGVDRYLAVVDADADGFSLSNEDEQEPQKVWLTYQQLDEIVAVLAPIRKINDQDREAHDG